MGNNASAPQAATGGGAQSPKKGQLAPRAVKFGIPAELGPILGACYCAAGANMSDKPPVVVAASADAVDLFNGFTG